MLRSLASCFAALSVPVTAALDWTATIRLLRSTPRNVTEWRLAMQPLASLTALGYTQTWGAYYHPGALIAPPGWHKLSTEANPLNGPCPQNRSLPCPTLSPRGERLGGMHAIAYASDDGMRLALIFRGTVRSCHPTLHVLMSFSAW